MEDGTEELTGDGNAVNSRHRTKQPIKHAGKIRINKRTVIISA